MTILFFGKWFSSLDLLFLLTKTRNPFTLISDLKYEHRRSPGGLQVLWQAKRSEDCVEQAQHDCLIWLDVSQKFDNL
jgi:hypothetical protein